MQLFIKTIFIGLILSVTVYAETVQKLYDNGKVHFEENYQDGKLHGLIKEYYETGELKTEIKYRVGTIVTKKEYRRDGQVGNEFKTRNGQTFEIKRWYYPTGDLFRERHLIDGKIEGLEIDYYTDGQKKAERNYINGLKEGSARGFHFNGEVQGDWTFKNGEPIAATLFYSTTEKWIEHSDFNEKGQLTGTSREYNKKGKLMALRYYENYDMVARIRIDSWMRWWYVFTEKTRTIILVILGLLMTILFLILGFKFRPQ